MKLTPKLVVADFETYYDSMYSLSKKPTEEYVRDYRFETIGLSLKLDDACTVWYPKPEVPAVIQSIDWSGAMVVAQNTYFDGAIFNWHYGVKPKAWLDTMGMSRALYPHAKSHSLAAQAEREGLGVKGDEVARALGKRYVDFSPEELARYGQYSCNDVELTAALFHKYLGYGFPTLELRLLDLTLRMFIEPVLQLDAEHLVSHLHGVQQRKEDLLNEVRKHLVHDMDPETVHAVFSMGSEGIKKLLMSNDKFAKLLRDFGVEPPMKISPATKKPAFAFAKTDEAFKALLEHEDERVQAIVAARLGNKSTLEETRTQRFIGMASRGAFPVPLRYYGAHSSRWSGQDSVNLQNLPARGPNAGKIKKAILAPDGHVIIDCDSSQIEARCLAWQAGQQDLLQDFANKADVYSNMASKIYGRVVNRKRKAFREDGTEYLPDEKEGHVGKATVLGAGYGMGGPKFQIHLRSSGVALPLEECGRIITVYRDAVPAIVRLWRKGQEALEALLNGQYMEFGQNGMFKVVPGKGISLPNGLYIQYPGLRKRLNEEGRDEFVYLSKGVWTRIYGPKVIENLTQGVARCVVAEQALRIAKRYKVVLLVHDAVACVAPEAEAKEAQAYVEECMSWRPKWAQDLPLACESGVGKSYGDC